MHLTISHVSFAYPEQSELLCDISASLEEGSRAALIGANGGGKSTLLQLLLEHLMPTSGHIQNPFHPRQALLNPVGSGESWGQAAWHQISGILVQEPAFLLLDEPTRHLDRRHRLKLAEWLNRLTTVTMVLVSHDLEFLDAVATHTWHLASGRLTAAACPPSIYLTQVEIEQESYRRRYQQQQETIHRLEQDIQETKQQARRTEEKTTDSGQRRYAKKVAKKALSREKRLEHWKESGEMLQASRDAHVLRYTWEHVKPLSGTLMRVEKGSIAWTPGRPVLKELFLDVRAGDRIGIMGDNGVGKSSLLEALLGQFPGFVDGYLRPPEVLFGYVQQVFDGSPAETCWQYFARHSSLPTGLGRAWLQSYGFSTNHLGRPVTALSQGEQVKLQIAAWSAAGIPLLCLDEPEHHLDWPSLDAVSRGLAEYPGALLVISHQPRFLEDLRITTRWTVAERRVTVEPWGRR